MNEEVQECKQGNGLAKKSWANEKTAGIRQETTEMQHEVMRWAVVKAKIKEHNYLYARLDCKEGEMVGCAGR